MAFRLPVTDPDTGAAFPDAYTRIEDASRPSLILATYVNGSAVDSGRVPVARTHITLSDPEWAWLRPRLTNMMYQILKQRSVWSQAEDV